MPMITPQVECQECYRIFDLGNDDDANEWYYGHDCEPGDDPDQRPPSERDTQ